jgi:hypothetical protein
VTPVAGARATVLRVALPGLLVLACGCGDPAPASAEPAPRDAAAEAARRRPPDAPVTAEGLRALFERLPPDRRIGSEGHSATRAMLLDELQALSWETRLHPVRWAGAAEADLANVEARKLAEEAGAPILIVCAHYDSVAGTPGADDNGSGTLALLELARRLAPRTLPIELRLLWFDAEEPGLVGSGFYLKAMEVTESRRLMGAINLETMGYTDRRAGSQRLPPGAAVLFDPGDRGDFLLVVGTLASAQLALVVGESLRAEQGPTFRVEVFSALPGAGWLFPDTRRSDHAQFWDAGHPAVMLTDTANLRSPHYHRSTDRVETLDLPFLAAAVRGVERAVLRLAGVEP